MFPPGSEVASCCCDAECLLPEFNDCCRDARSCCPAIFPPAAGNANTPGEGDVEKVTRDSEPRRAAAARRKKPSAESRRLDG